MSSPSPTNIGQKVDLFETTLCTNCLLSNKNRKWYFKQTSNWKNPWTFLSNNLTFNSDFRFRNKKHGIFVHSSICCCCCFLSTTKIRTRWIKNKNKHPQKPMKNFYLWIPNLKILMNILHILRFFIFLLTYNLVPDDQTMENFVNSLPLKLEELKSNACSNSGLIIVMGNEACDLVWHSQNFW